MIGNNKKLEIDTKNRTFYYFDDINSTNDLDPKVIKGKMHNLLNWI